MSGRPYFLRGALIYRGRDFYITARRPTMQVAVELVLLVLAFACFVAVAIGFATVGRFNLLGVGLALATAALIVPRL
jgi:hypothetical protein